MTTNTVKVLPEALVTIYADDGQGNLLDEVALFTDCYLTGVAINQNLELIRRESTGRGRRKIWPRTYDYSASFSEFYFSKVRQHDAEELYNRQVRLQFWLSWPNDPNPLEIWKLKIAVLDSFQLTGEDNSDFKYTATVAAELLG